jgi:predicted O-methyltransferase YrrM
MLERLSVSYAQSKALSWYLRARVRPPPAADRTPGYLHPLEGRFLYWLARSVPPHGTAVEIGSFTGKSSCFLAAGLTAGSHLTCVDTWVNDAMPYDQRVDVMDQFLANTAAYRDRIEPLRGTSVDVAATWDRPIDLLFIDGDHPYAGCAADVRAWLPFLRWGGWIAFHDSTTPGVRQAIAEHFPQTRTSRSVRIWSILATRKPIGA